MSHFTTLVLTTPGQSPEALLAPFEESVPHPEVSPFFVFQDITDEYAEQYANDTSEQIALGDGTFAWPWDDRFKTGEMKFFERTVVIPPHLKRVTRKMTEIYPDFPTFMDKHCGYTANAAGRFGHWSNPDAHWDWYSLGGRWAGAFHAEKHDIFPLAEWSGKTPFAVITPDGKWHEKGSMGWWGMVADEKEQTTWDETVKALLAQYPEAVAYNYDLHI